jgi:hypothetical protein
MASRSPAPPAASSSRPQAASAGAPAGAGPRATAGASRLPGRTSSCPLPGPAVPAPYTPATPAGAGPWAPSTARTARLSCAGSDWARPARAVTSRWQPSNWCQRQQSTTAEHLSTSPATGHLTSNAMGCLRCREASSTWEAICNSPALRRAPPEQEHPEDDLDYLQN